MRKQYCPRCYNWKMKFAFDHEKWCRACEKIRVKVGLQGGRFYPAVYHRARKNAVKRGIPFELTIDEFNQLVDQAKGKCTLSGIVFKFTRPRKKGKRSPFAPSLDRIDSSLGYTLENCRLISILANIALNEWGERPLLRFCKAVINQAENSQMPTESQPSNAIGERPRLTEIHEMPLFTM